MRIYTFIVIFIVMLTGCSTTTITPSVTEYKIYIGDLKSDADSSGCKEKSLRIAQAFSSNSMMSLDMAYVQGDDKIYSYSQTKWQNSPNQAITAEVLRAIRESKIFKTTQNSKSRASSDLILEINIEDFMQYYSQDLSESSSHVAISFAIVDTSVNKVISSETFRVKKDGLTLDAQGGVIGLNHALEELLGQLVVYLDEECK